jgi:hypothetical protein
MIAGKKIWSLSMLTIYLLVVLHHSIPHFHADDFDHNLGTTAFKHKDFDSINHEHDFHLGIFHLLAHLFESVTHFDETGEEHFFTTFNKQLKEDQQSNNSVELYAIIPFQDSSMSMPFFEKNGDHFNPILRGLQNPYLPKRGPPSRI